MKPSDSKEARRLRKRKSRAGIKRRAIEAAAFNALPEASQWAVTADRENTVIAEAATKRDESAATAKAIIAALPTGERRLGYVDSDGTFHEDRTHRGFHENLYRQAPPPAPKPALPDAEMRKELGRPPAGKKMNLWTAEEHRAERAYLQAKFTPSGGVRPWPRGSLWNGPVRFTRDD